MLIDELGAGGHRQHERQRDVGVDTGRYRYGCGEFRVGVFQCVDHEVEDTAIGRGLGSAGGQLVQLDDGGRGSSAVDHPLGEPLREQVFVDEIVLQRREGLRRPSLCRLGQLIESSIRRRFRAGQDGPDAVLHQPVRIDAPA